MKVSSGAGPTQSYLSHWLVETINTASLLIFMVRFYALLQCILTASNSYLMTSSCFSGHLLVIMRLK